MNRLAKAPQTAKSASNRLDFAAISKNAAADFAARTHNTYDWQNWRRTESESHH